MTARSGALRRSAVFPGFAALVGVLLVVSAGGAGASVDARARAQSSDAPSEAVLATLTVSSEQVLVRKDGKKKFKPATDGQALRQGDTVKTDATGTAEIDYGNDAFTRLDVDTTFTIVTLTEEQGARQVQGSLETGQTWNRTAALTESGSFEQEGAGANATVRGTAFAVLCDAVDHCTFTAVVDDIDLTGLDGVRRLLTPLTQCESSDTSGSGEVRDLTGVLCGDVTPVPADQLPAWILQNLVKDLTLGLPDGGILTGTVVVSDDGTVAFVPATAPGAPRNVHATPGDGQATVTFDPPESDGGSPITGYTATATPSGGTATALVVPVAVSATGPSSPIVVGPLVNGASYTFSVVATNALGSGPSSAPSPAIAPAGVPDAPTDVAALPGYEQATVAFTAPFDGGSAITSYTVTAAPGGATCTSGSTSCTVTGLDNLTTYTFTVTATNAVGTGPASGVSNTVTPPVVVPFGSTYQALIDPDTVPSGWEQPAFDDSGWAPSPAPFSNDVPTCSDTDFPPGASGFPSNSSVYLRSTFVLPTGASGLRVSGTVDNNATGYLNGNLLGSVSSGSCAVGAIDWSVDDSFLVAGENVLAVVATDTSGPSFVDLTVVFSAPIGGSAEPAAAVEESPPEDVPPPE